MQQRNDYKTVQDFLADESFRNWIRNQDDATDWKVWTAEDPQRARLVEQARLWVLATGVPETDLSPAETQRSLTQTWKKIHQAEVSSPTRIPLWQRPIWRNVAAAVVVLGLGFAWFYQSQVKPDKSLITYSQLIEKSPNELVEQENKTTKPQLITLSDGSSVLLEPNSKLSYPKSFDTAVRQVYLSGEGFFEISKNAKRPFFVYANEVVTRVVGTSFRIKAYVDQPTIDVTVRTGKVSVFSNEQISRSNSKDVVLLPNQGTRFRRQALAFEELPDPIPDNLPALPEGRIEQVNFEFRDVPVVQILETLEQAYQVEIDFPKQTLKDCYLTTSLTDQPLPEKLKIVCESLGNNTRYVMAGNHIVIHSSGCN